MDVKKRIFIYYRNSLERAGLKTIGTGSLICPLCWKEASYDALTIEHVVPSSIGGKATVLTCQSCNNRHGSSLDAHLSQYQRMADALKGHGSIPTVLKINGQRIVANLHLAKQRKDFVVVQQASDPAAIDAIKDEFNAGRVSEMNCSISFGYAKSNFQTAVLRAAYLVLFKCFGYEYVKHEIVQIIRLGIADASLEHPRLSSLVFVLDDFESPFDGAHNVLPVTIDDIPSFLVIIRAQKATETFLGAFMPAPIDGSDRFFDVLEKFTKEHDKKRVTIKTGRVFS